MSVGFAGLTHILRATATAMNGAAIRAPAIFVTHGGGPLPLMGQQVEIARELRKLASKLPQKPRAIVAISGHWEVMHLTANLKEGVIGGQQKHVFPAQEDHVTVLANKAPPMLYDYGYALVRPLKEL